MPVHTKWDGRVSKFAQRFHADSNPEIVGHKKLVKSLWTSGPDSSNTYEGVASGVGPLLGLVDLLEPLAASDAGRGAHVVDLEGLEADLLLLQLRRDLGVVVLRDQVGDDVEHLEGQVRQVLEHHGALEGGV